MDSLPEDPAIDKSKVGVSSKTSAWRKLSTRSRWLLVLAAIVVVSVAVAVTTVPRFWDSGLTASPGDTTEHSESNIDPLLDSDGDGIPDFLEITGWSVATGSLYVTDPNDPDTDGDGLSDGEEAGQRHPSDNEEIVYVGISDPTKVDSDEDGLTDKAEVLGWSIEEGGPFLTAPMNPDTDGDGLLDGHEAGEQIENAEAEQLFVGFSNPELIDTDGDGITDAEEADNLTDPYLPDSDGDGLEDHYEIQVVGTDPNQADTDGDGHLDAYEVENRVEQGLDPLFEDAKVTAKEYFGDFAKGALAGDAMRVDSLAWLAGNLVSSGSSFIPGVGWIIGGVLDTRDAVASAFQADWVGAGFSAVGIIPYVGDAAAIPKKVASFVVRNPELAAAVGALIFALNKVPESIKISALKGLTSEWSTLTKAGATDQALLRLSKSGRTNFDDLGAALKRDGHIEGPPSRYLADGPSGEKTLVDSLSENGTEVDTQVTASTEGCQEVCNPLARRFDAVVDGIAHESKVGFNDLDAGTRAQINSDAYLIETGVIRGAHWHFYPSAIADQVGANKNVLDLLEEKGIPFTIHMPTTK